MKAYTEIKGKKLRVKQVGNKFYYWSAAFRWLPVSKSKVIFE
jgi:hypothetical protein